ncbi:hypothetical protein [Xanthomonas phage Carpasina]|uniref:Helicase C-terminal domain-containing protein n=1 Tax=Xanthomonas phage Carpasina TaxID=2163636 RepID=A0A2S1GSR5_9CAUD|nr:DNA helicase [Xanthomonas phage Carpasina]AWD92437.1 hypothetical protein [Xanthomonas phage Carpasina]
MKTKGMGHQVRGLMASEGKRNYAYLMEQGTGKTWLTLADAERCFIENKIDALGVIAPKGVHRNWITREIPKHLSVETICAFWRGNPTTKRLRADLDRLYDTRNAAPALRVFAINIDALNTDAGFSELERFLTTFRVMLAVDESTRIKNPDSKRTKKVIKLGKHATARRILTGTPITKGPIDLFSQFDFLKPGLLGTTSYRAFVAEYAVLVPPGSPKMIAILRKTGGRGNPQVIDTDENGNKKFKNLDKLRDLILPHSYRVTKEDCLDLPPKIYKPLYFELTKDLRKTYDELEQEYSYLTEEGEDKQFESIAARTKMKQVTSGFIHIDGAPVLISPTENPRMDLFREVLEDIQGQFIVWAMFEQEILQIMQALEDAGISAVSYYGATREEAREAAIDDFQAGKVQGFVGHAAAAGIGLTLTAAETAVYYSCSYDNELRKQSEDRCHRIGTTNKVLYIDLIAENTIDEDIVKSLAFKTSVADYVIDRK